MEARRITNHRLINLGYTVLIMSAMLVLLALVGRALAGGSGLLWAVVLGLGFILFNQSVSPGWVLRMMGARPLGADEIPGLYPLAAELARRAKLPQMPRLYLIPGQGPNALTVGGRQAPAIALTSSLLRNLNRREVTAVLAHEISHLKHNDLQVLSLATAVSRLTGWFALLGQVLLFINLPFLLFGQAPISWLAILLLVAAPTLSGLLQLALSRTREYEADLGAVELTGDPEGLASALQKMEYAQAGLLRRLFPLGYRAPDALRTHPNTGERVRRLLSLADRRRPQVLEPEGYFLPQARKYTFRPWSWFGIR